MRPKPSQSTKDEDTMGKQSDKTGCDSRTNWNLYKTRKVC